MQQPTALRSMGIAGCLLLATSCSDVVRPKVDLRSVAGIYVLESVRGSHAPIAGSVTLTANGHAERRVQFDTTLQASQFVVDGTFDLRPDGSLEFAFNPCSVSCVWVVRAARTDEHFTLEYPDPADFSMISETYARSKFVAPVT